MFRLPDKKGREFGGAAVEYVIVSLFSAVVALAGVAFVSNVVQEKIEEMTSEFAIDSEFELDMMDAKP